MLMAPKGLEYWTTDKNGKTVIREDAPEWAKDEFRKYQEMLKHEPDENGVIIMY